MPWYTPSKRKMYSPPGKNASGALSARARFQLKIRQLKAIESRLWFLSLHWLRRKARWNFQCLSCGALAFSEHCSNYYLRSSWLFLHGRSKPSSKENPRITLDLNRFKIILFDKADYWFLSLRDFYSVRRKNQCSCKARFGALRSPIKSRILWSNNVLQLVGFTKKKKHLLSQSLASGLFEISLREGNMERFLMLVNTTVFASANFHERNSC